MCKNLLYGAKTVEDDTELISVLKNDEQESQNYNIY